LEENEMHPIFQLASRAARSLSVVAVATALLGSVGASGAAELIFNNYAPPTSPVTKVLFEDFAAEIENRTGGGVTVTIPGTSMAPVEGNWDLVTQGVVDVVNQARYVLPQKFRLTQIAELPFNTLSAEAASVALQRTYDKYFAGFDEYAGVKVLAFTVFAGRQIMNNTRPVETIEDYRGLKIWATPGPLAQAVEAVGAVPVVAPFPQLFEFASKGTVDGMIFTPGTARSSQTGPYVKHYTHVPGGLGNLSFALVMNIESWNNLSPEHQQIIQEIADTLPARFGKALDEDEAGALALMDVQYKQASPELVAAIKERLSRSEQAWIGAAREVGLANPEEVLAYYREQMEQLAAGN